MATTVNVEYTKFYTLYGSNNNSDIALTSNTTYAYIGSYNGSRRRTVFQFDVSLPLGAIITDLKLSFYCRNNSSPTTDSYYIAMTKENLKSFDLITHPNGYTTDEKTQLVSLIEAIEGSTYTYKQNGPSLLNELKTGKENTEALNSSVFSSLLRSTSYTVYVVMGLNATYTYGNNHYVRIDEPTSTNGATKPKLSITYVQGTMQYYTEGVWKECLVHYYDGSKWIQVMPKYYTGTQWVQVR